MSFFILFLYSLTTFRLAEMLVIDDGPFDVIMNLRGWLCQPNAGSLRKTIGNLFQCVHCAGFWLAFALTFTLPYHSLIEFGIYFLSIAGLQSVIAIQLGRTA